MSTLARSSALNLIGSALFGVFGFLALVIVARGAGPQRAGTFLEGVAFFTIATSLVVLGFDESMVRAISQILVSGRPRSIGRTLLVALVPLFAFSVVVGAAVWLLAPEVASSVAGPDGKEGLATYLRFFAVALPFTALYYAFLAATRGFGTMVPTVAIERIGRTLAQAVGVAIAIALGGGAPALALAWVLPFMVGTFVAAAQLRTLIARRTDDAAADVDRPTIAEAARGFWRFSSLRGIASIFQTTFLWLDTLIVGALVSASATAIYTTSSRMVRLGSLVLLAITQAVGPQISELLHRHEPARAERVYRISTWWLMIATWPLYLTMAIFAPVLLRIFGVRYDAGAAVVVTMCGAMLLSTAIGAVDMVLLMAGRSGWNLINSAVALSTNVALNLLLVPRFGIEGAAIAWAVAVALNNLLPYAEIRASLGISPFSSPGIVPAAGAAIGYGVIGCAARLALGPNVVSLLLTVALGTIVYLAFLRRFGSSLELRSLLATIRPKTSRPIAMWSR